MYYKIVSRKSCDFYTMCFFFQSGKKDRLPTLLATSQGLSIISFQLFINKIDIHINQTWN